MTSVAELRVVYADEARDRSQIARNAARQAFTKLKQPPVESTTNKYKTLVTPVASSLGHNGLNRPVTRQRLSSLRPSAPTRPATQLLPVVQRPPLPSSESKAASAAAVTSVWRSNVPKTSYQGQQPQLQSYQQYDEEISRSRQLSLTRPASQAALSIRNERKCSTPSARQQSRPETRASHVHSFVVTEGAKVDNPSASGIAAALAAARCAPSIQPTTQYVELLPASAPISHVRKWLQTLESLSPEQISPLRSNRGPWIPTVVNMPEVPPKPAHLSRTGPNLTPEDEEPEQCYFDSVETPEALHQVTTVVPSTFQLPSFQINSTKTANKKSIVDTIEETSFGGMETVEELEVVKRKPVPVRTELASQRSAPSNASLHYDGQSKTKSLVADQARDGAVSRRASQSRSIGRRSLSSSQLHPQYNLGKPDYFYNNSQPDSGSQLTMATSPETGARSVSRSRPAYSRMDSRSTVEKFPRGRVPSLGSTTDISSNVQQADIMVMSPPPIPRPLPFSRRSYMSTHLSLSQLPPPTLLSENTGGSLPSRSAILASNLAASRAPSPTKEIPSSSQRQGERSSNPLKYFRSRSQNRTPSPTKKFRRTLRKDRSSEDNDEPKARRRNKLIRKHPHKHNEGDRKRWRDTITDRERKRYEGLWAANRGIYIYGEPIDGRTEGTTQDPAQAQKVCNLVVRDIWLRSRLPDNVLEEIWELVDTLHDGTLRKEEFVVGMWLIDQRLKGRKLPVKVGLSVWDSVWLVPGVKRRKLLK